MTYLTSPSRAGSGSSAISTVIRPSAGSTAIQAAMDEAAAAGEGVIIQLTAGTYTIPDINGIGIDWPGDASNIVLQGIGPDTVLASEVDQVGYTLNIKQTITGELLSEACSNISASQSQVTLTTAANAAFFTKGMIVCVRGTDADSRPRQVMNEVLADGNGGSGVVTLTSIFNEALTSVNINGYPFGYGNGVRNLKIIHTANSSHAVGFTRQVGGFLENVVMDGADFSGSYAVELNQDNHNIRISNCVIRNYKYDGASANGQGLIMSDCSDVLIENTLFHKNGDITGTNKPTIYIAGQTENITIRNCDVKYSSSYGINGHNAGWGLNILIDGCTFSHNQNSGVFIDNATQYQNVRIVNCHFNNNLNCGVEFVGTQSVIANNTTYRNAVAGIFVLSASTYVTVADNVCIKDGTDAGILSTASDITITGNNCSLQANGIYCFSTGTNINVSGNVCNGNTRGIRFDGGTYITVAGNTARGNSTAALLVDNACNNMLIGLNNFRGDTVTVGTGANIATDFARDFTPTVTLVGGAGNTVPVYTTNVGRFWRVGDKVEVEVYLTGDGGAEGAGTGVVNIALPIAASASHQTSGFFAGYGLNNVTEYQLMGQIAPSATTISLRYFNLISTTASFTGAEQNNATRTIRLKFNYEA